MRERKREREREWERERENEREREREREREKEKERERERERENVGPIAILRKGNKGGSQLILHVYKCMGAYTWNTFTPMSIFRVFLHPF
jgi:hypothetical protein